MESMTAVLTRSRSALVALAAVSAAGTADVADFLARRPQLFSTAPGRAAGSVLGLTIWMALAGVALRRMQAGDQGSLRAATLGLAAVNALGNLGLTFIHVKAGVGGWRPLAGGLLGIAALTFAFLARER
jgi:hypothetical protein